MTFHSLLDSSHGGSYGLVEGMTSLDEKRGLFGKDEHLRFPVTEETEAWKEKVSLTGCCLM